MKMLLIKEFCIHRSWVLPLFATRRTNSVSSTSVWQSVLGIFLLLCALGSLYFEVRFLTHS